MTEDEIIYSFFPETNGRLPTTIYAVKYRVQKADGKMGTYIFLLSSKSAYDERIAGPEKGQGMQGTVTWSELTPPVKKSKPPQEESLF